MVQTLFWVGGTLCLAATLLPLTAVFRAARFVRQAAWWLLLGGADKILPVDVKILGNPPTPEEILRGLVALMALIKERRSLHP